MRVKVLSDEGTPFATITAIEYQRSRVVLAVDGLEKLAVRPSGKVMIKKTKSGKIERVARAIRAGKATAEVAPAPAEVPAEA
jgi:hypothetical protein